MNILSICDEPSVLEIMNIIVLLINIIKVVVPIALIIVLMLKFAKAVTSNNDDLLGSVKKSAPANVIAAVLIFLVPTFVSIVVGIAFPNSDYTKCIDGLSSEKVTQAYENKAESLVSLAEQTISVSDYNAAVNYLKHVKDETKKKTYNQD